ncbi:MAG: M48 family metalloprotease [Synechococcales cyanobacterium RM1_1_8]|nr:M48 family metalloprotease [Synechococcales cyanobacterium RM1_1_8]
MKTPPSFLRPSRIPQRLAIALAGLSLSTGLAIGGATSADAFSWRDLLRGGIQIVQGVQLSNLSPEQEMSLGADINKQLLQRDLKLYRGDPGLVAYVDQIGQRLAQQSDRPELTYKFQVVEDDQINAYATLGGYVYVTTGLMKLAANEAELAGVIGHEIGHIEGKHLISQMSREAWRGGLMSAAGVDRNRAVQIGMELAVRRPRSRENEYDADLRGLRIMREATYAESAMVSFMGKLAQKGGAPPTFLSTHPHGKDRVLALQRNLNPTVSGNTGLDEAYYSQQIRALGRRNVTGAR